MNALEPSKIAEARRAYESGAAMASIARQLSIRRQTLIAHRDREGWVRDMSAQACSPGYLAIRERAQSSVIELASRRAIEKINEDGAIDDLAAVLRRQNVLAAKLTVLAEELVDDVLSGKVEPAPRSSRATLIVETIAAAERAQAFARTCAGIKTSTTKQPEHKAQPPKIRRFVVQTPEEIEAHQL